MSDLILNDVIDFSYPYSYRFVPARSQIWNSAGSVNQVIEHSNYDYMEFNISLQSMTATDKDSAIEFFVKHKINQDTFLLKDEWGYGYEVARQSIGTGDGSEDEFQLIETVGSYDYNRYDIIASSYTIWVNNVQQTEGAGNDYTIDTTSSGVVTFNAGSIPGNTHDVEALYEYYRRVIVVSDLTGALKSTNNNAVTVTLRTVNVAA